MRLSFAGLAASLLALTSPAALAAPLTMEQIMADPDWIGAAAETPFWRWDNQHVIYAQKRQGSHLRDQYRISLTDGQSRLITDQDLADLDTHSPVYDSTRSHALFVRNGDLFLRTLSNGQLQQLTRDGSVSGRPMFSADGRSAIYQAGDKWFELNFQRPIARLVAQLKAEKDPNNQSNTDQLRDLQLELIATLAKQKAEADALREHNEALRLADPTRAPAAIYLGDDIKIAGSVLSPNGRWLLAITEDKNANRGQGGKMPLYVTASGYEEVEDVRTRVGRNTPIGQSLVLVDVSNGKITAISTDTLPGITVDPLAELRSAAGKEAIKGNRPARINGIQFSADGQQAAIQWRSVDNKDRWIASVSLETPTLKPLHRLTDNAWINWNFNDFGWLPDNRTLWLLSEESGYSHLYTVDARGKTKALTSGAWEASDPQVSADGSRFLFICNRQWPGDYELCAKDLRGGSVRELTAFDGVESFSQSPDGQSLLISYSQSHLPTQLATMPAQGGDARVLTNSRSEAYAKIDWPAPQFVPVPSSHEKLPLWSKFYRPETLEAGKTYPIVLFVHGAGYTQNTHARYPYYFREQMFHHLLVEQGYLVLDIDFRASEGYGRDWRTAIYRRMGEPELQDLIDGVNWLVENHQGDAGNVGVYGGSYGGFMSLMAMFKAPDIFHAGAALRPVTDWTQYNHPYTANILNTPDIDEASYRNSSPIFFAEGLKGNLLIAHGMMDDNVFYQDSVRLAQRLIELKKENWELASYPLERHGYVQPDAWLDQYRRIYKLFETTLKD